MPSNSDGEFFASPLFLSKDPAERALVALRQFAAGNQVPVYEFARLDRDALLVIDNLPPQYRVGAYRDPFPDEIVDPARQFIDGTVFCSCTVGDVQHAIRVALAQDAARRAALEAMAETEEPAFLDSIDEDAPLPRCLCTRHRSERPFAAEPLP